MKRRFPLFIICGLLLATAALAQTQRANRVFPTPRVPCTYCRSRMIRHVCFSVAEKRSENGACNLYTCARILRIRAKGKDPRHCSVGGGHQCHRSRGNVVRVVKPLEPGLDQSAVDAINKWRFTPAPQEANLWRCKWSSRSATVCPRVSFRPIALFDCSSRG